MGQDTDCDFGVAYHCTLNANNYDLIRQLARIEEMHIYVEYGDCEDEKRDITDAIYMTTNPEQMKDYNEVLTELKHNIEYHHFSSGNEYEGKLDKVELIFHYIIMSGYARNISRRRNPTIYNPISENPRDIIEKFDKAINSFTELGINEKDLLCSSLMSDW
jgi:hypothetical protein